MGARGTRCRRIRGYGTARMEQCTSTCKICKPGCLGELSSDTRDSQEEEHCWPRPWGSKMEAARLLRAALWAVPHTGGMFLPCKNLCCDQGSTGAKPCRIPYQRGQRDTLNSNWFTPASTICRGHTDHCPQTGWSSPTSLLLSMLYSRPFFFHLQIPISYSRLSSNVISWTR